MQNASNKKSPAAFLWLLPLLMLAAMLAAVLILGQWTVGAEVPETELETLSQQPPGRNNNSDDGAWENPILKPSVRADYEYFAETFFLGDSNTERMYLAGKIELSNMMGKTGMRVTDVAQVAFLRYEADDAYYTIPQALCKCTPRRIVLTLGTNDLGKMSAEAFVTEYRALIKEIEETYPYCDIIVNAIPPFARKNSYPHLTLQDLEEFNEALVKMCGQDGLAFLNSYEALAGADGYMKEGYTTPDGLHFTDEAIEELVEYFNTHVLETTDRRQEILVVPKRSN